MPRPRAAAPTYKLVRKGGGVWYVEWWDAARRQPRRFSTWTTDEGAAKDELAKVRAGLVTPPPPPTPVLRDILKAYFDDRIARGRADTLRAPVDNLVRHLGGLTVDHLSQEVADAYYAARREEGRPAKGGGRQTIADGTLIKEACTLRAAIRWAIGKKWMEAKLEPKIEVPSAPPPRSRFLTPEEYDRLLAAAQADHIRLFITLALATAGRKQAIIDCTWAQLDEAMGLLDLGRGKGNKRRAVVPLTEDALEVLREARATARSDRVVEWRGEGVQSIRTGFAAAVRRAGLGSDVTPHVIRHTAATWMAMDGVPLADIAAFLGDSEKVVAKVYRKFMPDYLRKAASALSRRRAQPAEQAA